MSEDTLGAACERLPRSACTECLRRSWLLAELSPILDLNCRADGRLFELLALEDDQLMRALGGRRRVELQRRHAGFRADALPRKPEVTELCVHDGRYPSGLRLAGIAPLLHLAGGVGRFCELTTRPVVAIVGTRRASDYGRAMADDLARGLSASGVTVAALRDGGIAAAALAGALESGGATLAVAGSGLDVASAVRRRASCAQLRRGGCVTSELPCGVDGRRWGAASAERLLAALAAVTLVVEAHENPRELTAARFARSLDRPVAAVPGRATSAASAGCHTLLRDGARLVRGPADVLDLLYDADSRAPAPRPGEVDDELLAELEPRLRTMLERVSAGADTPGKLAREQDDVGEMLRALSELELLGLLSRGDGGRYVVRVSVQRQSVRYVWRQSDGALTRCAQPGASEPPAVDKG
jgi:DNA processing protein